MTGLGNNFDDLRELVRKIVREGLQALRANQASSATVSIVEIIREEVKQAMRIPEPAEEPLPEELRCSYAAAVRQPYYGAPPTVASIAPKPLFNPRPRSNLPYPREMPPRKIDLGRTPDHRPLFPLRRRRTSSAHVPTVVPGCEASHQMRRVREMVSARRR
ncbi:hypothetical protein HPB48_010661 [Haemaphysalis longicornis]|uniref:Uncharacterized protein n=1 Tax=Haemaphysalis longicornis TaxID=44386 RepID=A0A9J6GC52_HAELO|nr:hypothetical protein HPB48_010661 [Haemaphysalis longicornis]